MRVFVLVTLSAAGLGLTGCHHLLDQTDFKPKPPPAVVRTIPDPETRKPLVTIEYTKANPDFRTALADVIRTVEARRPGTLYDIVAFAGGAGEALQARMRAADVMTAVEADGVIPTRIALGLTIEPGRKVQQVRVYLR